MQKEEIAYSYHTFMLPFVFEGKFKEKEPWKCKNFQLKTTKEYNEYIYFYKHVQDALFGKKCDEAAISKYYDYEYEEGSYCIESKKGTFVLDLDGLSLRIFNTNVAILAFNFKNTRYYNQNDILAINDFGRRIYPQFLGKNFTVETKDSVLAYTLTLSIDDKEYKEDFTRFDKVTSLQDNQLSLMPIFVQELLEYNFDNFKNIKPVIDDRMFVISQYNSDALSHSLQTLNEKETYSYTSDDWWYKYLFVDGDSKTCQNKFMAKKLIEESSYARWIELGTLFGISRYSFVALTGSWYGKNRLLPHMQTMYFQIFSLLLAYRASIIKFSDDIQNVTSKSKNIEKETQKLYKNYLNFLNKLYFKEVTAQEQGIELYNQAMKIMDIDKYMKDLDNEINELHSYVAMIEEKKRNKQLDNISVYGGTFLFASVVTGFFGMNVGSNNNFSPWITYPVIAIAIYSGYRNFFKKGVK